MNWSSFHASTALLLSAASVLLACGANGGSTFERQSTIDESGLPPEESSGLPNESASSEDNEPVNEPAVNLDDPAGEKAPVTEEGACRITQADATLVKEPVDIILVLDNSGSMEDELESVEQNINVNFANILKDSDVDYRLILISRHRKEDRSASEEASTSICVEAPLSGLASCPADEPVLSDRFFQYSTKIESTDSFDIILDAYEAPYDESDHEDKYDNAEEGWKIWLRDGAKKVFLEMTDDNAEMPVDTFVNELTAMAPEHFGSDADHLNFIFHSIIGIAEKADPAAAYLPDEPVVSEKCTGNNNDVENAGESYQVLSQRTGGLRFPLCQFQAYDTVFRTIAEDVVVRSDIQCDFAIPEAPPDTELELNNVAVRYTPGDGSEAIEFGQAAVADQCQDDAFYIDGDRIFLCPETCDRIKADPLSSVDVLFTCSSTIIIY